MPTPDSYRFPSSTSDPSEKEWEEARAQQLWQEEKDRRIGRCQPHLGLKRIRKEHRLTQAKMAELLAVSRRTYQDFENGKRAIPSETLSLLYGHFNCNLHTLITGETIPISRKDRASLVDIALDAAGLLANQFPDISFDRIHHYAALTAELTEPGDEPEWLWLTEMVSREVAGLPPVGFDDENEY